MDRHLENLRKARRKYEKTHVEERKAATRQFNTRLPTEDYEEICGFLKENRISKVAFIYMGYELLKDQLEKERSKQNG